MSEELQSQINSVAQKVSLAVGADWLKCEAPAGITFVETGLLKRGNYQGNEFVVKGFYNEGCTIPTRNDNEKTKRIIQTIVALEPSIIHYIAINDLEHIYEQYPEFNFIGRILTERGLTSSQEHIYMFKIGPRERFKYIIERYPWLLMRVPRKDLAAYLGMNEETFDLLVPGQN